MIRDCIVSSLTTCSGQGVVVQGKRKEKERVVEDIRNKSSQDSSRRAGELWGAGGSGGSSPRSGVGAIDTALLRGDEGVPSGSSGRLGLVLQGEELIRPSGAELGLWI